MIETGGSRGNLLDRKKLWSIELSGLPNITQKKRYRRDIGKNERDNRLRTDSGRQTARDQKSSHAGEQWTKGPKTIKLFTREGCK